MVMTCDYCDGGNTAKDGWHVHVADDPDTGEPTSYTVPCTNESWCARGPGHDHPSRLCPDEDEAVGDILDGD